MKYHYKHIVVVHGMGNQAPNETSLGFMNEFIRALPRENHCVKVDNLIEQVLPKSDSSKNTSNSAQQKPRKSFKPAYLIFHHESNPHVISFSEVYWKQIPDHYICSNKGHLPIPIFTWFRSINTRLFPTADEKFHRSRQVIDNLEKMLRLAKNLFGYFKKSREFVHLLERSLGDVQMYAESSEIREVVNERFLSVMSRIDCFKNHTLAKIKEDTGDQDLAFENTEIFIVAHSEGSVVAYNSLVQAAECWQNDLCKHPWLPLVRGLVTLGSPLDKHYTIWRNSFRKDRLNGTDGSRELKEKRKIPWFNYWDHSDPAGYALNKLFCSDSTGCQTDATRLFKVEYDKGFTRYPIPGLAHIGYWKDNEIYEHIIDRVMDLGTTRPDTTVKSKRWGFLHRFTGFLLYLFVRLATLAIMMFCLTMILIPVGCLGISEAVWLRKMASLMSAPMSSLWEGFDRFPLNQISLGILSILGLLLLIKGLWTFYTSPCIRGCCAKLVYIFRKFLLVPVLVALIFLFCLFQALYLPDHCKPEINLVEWFGYLIGLIIGASVWRLHTTVHRGIVQMWRHTRGDRLIQWRLKKRGA